MYFASSQTQGSIATERNQKESQRGSIAPKKLPRLGSGLLRALPTPKHRTIDSEFSRCETPLGRVVPGPPARHIDSGVESDRAANRAVTLGCSVFRGLRRMFPSGPVFVRRVSPSVQASAMCVVYLINILKLIGCRISVVEGRFLLLIVSSIGIVGGASGVGSTENASLHPYGEIGYGYWGQGVTNYPCSGPAECALLFNSSDPLRDAILLEEDSETTAEPCVVNGHLAKSVNWYGYLTTLQLRAAGGRIYYRFVYPEDRCCIKIIFYLEEQVLGLRARMNCLQKQSMVDPRSRQVILLSPTDKSSGCVSNKTENGIRVIECTSGRVLKSNEDRNWYIAASSCGSPTGLDLQYSFVAYGNKGKCPEPDAETNAATHHAIHESASFKAQFRLYTLLAGFLYSWRHLIFDTETIASVR